MSRRRTGGGIECANQHPAPKNEGLELYAEGDATHVVKLTDREAAHRKKINLLDDRHG